MGQPKAAVSDAADWWPGKGISPRLPGKGAATTLSTGDAEAIAREIRGVSFHTPGVSDTAVVTAAPEHLFARLQGTGIELPSIRMLTPRAGRFFTAGEIAGHERVAVLSSGAAAKLFGG
jgi:hypothetical protein